MTNDLIGISTLRAVAVDVNNVFFISIYEQASNEAQLFDIDLS